MTLVFPRRSERITLRRKLDLVFRDPRGRISTVTGMTFAVSCHGCGLYARPQSPLGSEVFVMNSLEGLGAWGHLVWEGHTLRDGRQPVGIEFVTPKNYWGQRMIPRSWLPYAGPRERLLPEIENDPPPQGLRSRGAYPGEQCRCCGSVDNVVVLATHSEPLCKVCRSWTL
jgi:hypothetical protein